VPFVGETHGDAVVAERPDLLDQAVVELALPLARQECLDGGAALEDFGAVAPAAVGRVGERDASGITRVPGVFGEPRLLRRDLGGERGKRRAAHSVFLDRIRNASAADGTSGRRPRRYESNPLKAYANVISLRARAGSRSLPSALASIWRMRSRVTPKTL